jgi:uncharacterized membrane protein
LKPGSLLSKAVALIVTALLIVFGLMFGAIILTIIATVGVIAFGYLWWKTRLLRKHLRQHNQTVRSAANDADAFKDEVFKGEIIEGEVIRKVVSIEEIKR